MKVFCSKYTSCISVLSIPFSSIFEHYQDKNALLHQAAYYTISEEKLWLLDEILYHIVNFLSNEFPLRELLIYDGYLAYTVSAKSQQVNLQL